MESRTVNVGGTHVHYLFGGSERNRAVVILHGWAGDSSALQQLGQLLSEKHFVVIPDLPGFGKSGKVASPTFEEFAALLNAFLEKIGVSKASLVGHSMGGGVAIEIAKLFPERVNKLVLVDSVGQRIDRSLLGWVIAGVRNMVRDMTEEKPADIGNATVVWEGLKRPIWLLRTFFMIRDRDLTGELRQIKAQTVVVWAEQDVLVPTCAQLCLALGVEPVIIKGAGHDWIILDPEMASRVIGGLI